MREFSVWKDYLRPLQWRADAQRKWHRQTPPYDAGPAPSTSLGMTGEAVQYNNLSSICHPERSRGICPYRCCKQPFGGASLPSFLRKRLPLEGKLSPKVTDEVCKAIVLHLIRLAVLGTFSSSGLRAALRAVGLCTPACGRASRRRLFLCPANREKPTLRTLTGWVHIILRSKGPTLPV